MDMQSAQSDAMAADPALFLFYWDTREDTDLGSYEGYRIDKIVKGRSGTCKAQASSDGKEVPSNAAAATGWQDGSKLEMAIVEESDAMLVGGAGAVRIGVAGFYSLVKDHPHDHGGKAVYPRQRPLEEGEMAKVTARVEELGLLGLPVPSGCCIIS